MSANDNIHKFFENELKLSKNRRPQSLELDPSSLSQTPLLEQAAFIRARYLELEMSAFKPGNPPGSDWANLGAGLVDILNMLASSDGQGPLVNLSQDTVLASYQKRIENLEKFRQLYFELDDQCQSGVFPQPSLYQAPLPVDRSNLNGNIQTINEGAVGSEAIVEELKQKIKEFADKDVENEKFMAEQMERVQQLEKNQEESKNCMGMLETEMDRLLDDTDRLREENEKLASQLAVGGVSVSEAVSAAVPAPVEAPPTANGQTDEEKDRKITSLEGELEQTSEMVFGFMKGCADLGAILLFTTECNLCVTVEEVADKLFHLCASMGLPGALLLDYNGKQIFLKGKEDIKISKDSKLWGMNSDSRLEIHGDFFVLHGTKSKFCVSTAGVDDSDTMDRAKDNMQTLSKSLDSVLLMIETMQKSQKETERFQFLLKSTKEAMDAINVNYKNHMGDVRDLSEKLIVDYRSALQTISMDAGMKNHLLKMIVETSNNILRKSAASMKMDQDFTMLIERFNQTQ